MSYIDYGSVVKKNGKIIQKDFFMDMKESVGFVINKIPYSYEANVYNEDYDIIGRKTYNSELQVKGNYFSYIGDKDLLLCIYKGSVLIISNNKIVENIHDLFLDYYIPFELQQRELEINGVKIKIKRLAKDRNRYKLRFWYKNDLYECLYGYGVDINKNLWYGLTPKEKRYIDKWFREE